MKKNIAIVAGGYSPEFDVSLRSADNLFTFIDKEKYNAYIVVLKKDAWEVVIRETEEAGETKKTFPIDKSDFSFRQGNTTVKFDFAYITIHGTPGEDGLLQGYFDMLEIPYSTCDVLTSALTFNKYMCNQYLKGQHIRVSDSMLIRKGQSIYPEHIATELGLPVFVKPNKSGSSFGISKVMKVAQIQDAVEKAFSVDSEVLIERFIPGNEFTCGCYQSENRVIVFPVTEVIPKNDFFDYGAKYNGEVWEITPARISDQLSCKIQYETEKIYKLIGAHGIIRIDYIVPSDEIPVLLEVNTTPGMTSTSFIPQQVQAAGLKMKDIMTNIIENK
jgi:D-alanine--D-alanine ligase